MYLSNFPVLEYLQISKADKPKSWRQTEKEVLPDVVGKVEGIADPKMCDRCEERQVTQVSSEAADTMCLSPCDRVDTHIQQP